MEFKTGDIIKYANTFFEVKSNHGRSGEVYELNDNLVRTGVLDSNFYWEAHGEACELISKQHEEA